MEQQEGIIDSMCSSIIDCNKDLLMDIGEIGIDFVFEDSPLKEFPIVKIVCSVAKTGMAIRERHLLNKTLSFIKKLNSNNLDSEEYELYKEKLRRKDKILYRDLEHVLIILDRLLEKEKASILANLYSAYINKKLTFDDFKNYSIILNNFLLTDLNDLEKLYNHDCQIQDMQDGHGTANRLISLGFAYTITGFTRHSLNRNMEFNPPTNDIAITEFGRKFVMYGLMENNY